MAMLRFGSEIATLWIFLSIFEEMQCPGELMQLKPMAFSIA